MTDLTERLQRKAAFLNEDCDCGECVQCHGGLLMSEAAITLDALAQENARLREALRRVVSVDQERHWTATKENPETHLEIMDGQCARIARKALGGD